ncbi:hypothetical protein A6R68_09849, partial [Neotoma lepida]
MASFGLKDFLNDFGCKGLFYLHSMCRSVSIGSTSFLSVYQAITISPQECSLVLLEVSALLAGCFSTVRPFLLLSLKSSVSMCFCFIYIKK